MKNTVQILAMTLAAVWISQAGAETLPAARPALYFTDTRPVAEADPAVTEDVVLLVSFDENKARFVCQGIAIGMDVILGEAECFARNSGAMWWSSYKKQNFVVDVIILHPEFISGQKGNNIAIGITKNVFKMETVFQLPSPRLQVDKPRDVTISSFIKSGKKWNLQSVRTTWVDGEVTPGTAAVTSDFCWGDIGAVAYLPRKTNPLLLGINTSADCEDRPDFANVADHADWIVETVRKEGAARRVLAPAETIESGEPPRSLAAQPALQGEEPRKHTPEIRDLRRVTSPPVPIPEQFASLDECTSGIVEWKWSQLTWCKLAGGACSQDIQIISKTAHDKCGAIDWPKHKPASTEELLRLEQLNTKPKEEYTKRDECIAGIEEKRPLTVMTCDQQGGGIHDCAAMRSLRQDQETCYKSFP